MWGACIVGPCGSGKSWAGLSIANLLDRAQNGEPRFSIDRVCFSAKEFAEAIAKPWPKGTAIVLDDSGLSLYSRESMSRIVKRLTKTFMSMRYKNLCVILTLPSFKMLDLNVRSLLDAYLEMVDINFDLEKSQAKFHYLQTSAKDGKIFHHRPERVEWSRLPDGYPLRQVKVLDSIYIDRPPQHLIESYEEKKKGFLDKWNSATAKEFGSRKPATEDFKAQYKKVRGALPKYLDARGKVSSAKLMLNPGLSEYRARALSKLLNEELKAKKCV